jgi:phasin family protein
VAWGQRKDELVGVESLHLPSILESDPYFVAMQQKLLALTPCLSILRVMLQRSKSATTGPLLLSTCLIEREIMNFTPEQLLAAQKANVETLFGLTTKAFEGVEKLVELNLQVARATLGEAAETTKAALSVKDAQELLALQAGLLQPAAEKAAAYSRHLYDIMAGTNAAVTQVTEAKIADAQKSVLAVVDNAVKNAPAGTENAVALVKSAVAAANNAYESVHKAAKQATEVAEANFTAMTNTAVKATQAATKSGKRAA